MWAAYIRSLAEDSFTLAQISDLSCALYYLSTFWYGYAAEPPGSEAPACPQAQPLPPTSHGPLLQTLDALFHSEMYRLRAYESLGGAVRIPTETQDEELPPSEDPQHWSVFGRLHAYLEDRFPLIYLNLTVAKVNSYALVFHWQGSDISLKPILLTAHQDVVPVEPETASHWVHPPYSGFFDGKYIWGRGSCDDKSGLIASMTAIETLLDNGFKPERSIVLAFGIDEERGGVYGATAIRDYLLKKYGENAFSILVDEGGGYSDMFGTMFATPAIAEKGKLDVRIEVATPGGHSSIPPAHTSIGILSRLITELEANPHSSTLKREGTYYQQLQCLAEHGPSLPPALGETIKDSRKSDKALSRLGEMLDRIFPTYKPSTGTTQAVDIVRGGVKSNALPERAYAIINHRIADYSSVTEVQARFASIVSPLARSFNLSFKAFENESFLDDNQQPMSSGQLALTDAYGSGLNPAPITPTDRSGPWQLLSGTILFAFATNQRTEIKHGQVAVAPGLSLGNTDTRYYWNLTQHIFRYGHLGASDRCNGAHTINEAVKAEGYLEMIRFFTLFILNADKTDLLE
ncbi:Zn-dependent exopeptidase [Phellopilus nigrolimitatus]|nr:Zn-dependent exopeptidase [Phellopilus nigrolimitatus]